MAIYRIFPSSDGESHIEEMNLSEHPELGELTCLSEVSRKYLLHLQLQQNTLG